MGRVVRQETGRGMWYESVGGVDAPSQTGDGAGYVWGMGYESVGDIDAPSHTGDGAAYVWSMDYRVRVSRG